MPTRFQTTLAGSLPKPAWLAETQTLWPAWKQQGEALADAKADATLMWLKEQEAAGIDIVTDGEQSRQHFVHGFLEHVDGVDFGRKVKMGIRNNRYDAMVPTVTAELRLRGRVHATEARLLRSHTDKKIKITMPGPMTIVDTLADEHYGDRVKMAFAFARLLNQEARALQADGVDVVQFDEPAFNVYMEDAVQWGIEALHVAREGLTCTTAVHICYGYGIEQNIRWKHGLGEEWRQVRGSVSGAREKPDRPGVAGMRQLARADEADRAAGRQGRAGRRDRRRDRHGGNPGGGGDDDRGGAAVCAARKAVSLHQLRHGADGAPRRRRQAARPRRRRATGERGGVTAPP